MKKKLSILLCILVFVMGLAGCSSQNKGTEYHQEELEQVAEFLVNNFSQMTDEQLGSLMDSSEFMLNYTLMTSGMPLDGDVFTSAIESWISAKKECGEYEGHGDYELEIKGSSAVLRAPAQYSDRDAALEFTFDKNAELEALTVNAKYSTGEILEKAGLNTILGMGTVFTVLIFMAWLISLMKYIPIIAEKFTKKSEKAAAPAPAAEAPVVEEEEELADDLELVAVIAAAIAEYEGTSADGFVVRSIKKRRKPSKWNA